MAPKTFRQPGSRIRLLTFVVCLLNQQRRDWRYQNRRKWLRFTPALTRIKAVSLKAVIDLGRDGSVSVLRDAVLDTEAHTTHAETAVVTQFEQTSALASDEQSGVGTMPTCCGA